MKIVSTKYSPAPFGIALAAFFAWSFFASAQQSEPGSVPETEPVQVDVTIYDQEPGSGTIPQAPEGGFRENMPKRTDGPRSPMQSDVGQRIALPIDRQNRIINLSRNMQAHMSAAIERLEQITTRIESRMRKLETMGVDTTDAREALELSKTSLLNAKATLENIDARVVGGVSGDTPREQFKELKTTFVIARNAIKDAHVHLQTVVLLLKEAVAFAPNTQGVSDAVRNDVGTTTETDGGTTESSSVE